MGLDNMFSAFCQIFLDKIKKMLYNKSTLIKYNSTLVNMANRGGAKNAKIKNSKILPFHFKVLPFSFLTEVKVMVGDAFSCVKYYPQLQKLQLICSSTYYYNIKKATMSSQQIFEIWRICRLHSSFPSCTQGREGITSIPLGGRPYLKEHLGKCLLWPTSIIP